MRRPKNGIWLRSAAKDILGKLVDDKFTYLKNITRGHCPIYSILGTFP